MASISLFVAITVVAFVGTMCSASEFDDLVHERVARSAPAPAGPGQPLGSEAPSDFRSNSVPGFPGGQPNFLNSQAAPRNLGPAPAFGPQQFGGAQQPYAPGQASPFGQPSLNSPSAFGQNAFRSNSPAGPQLPFGIGSRSPSPYQQQLGAAPQGSSTSARSYPPFFAPPYSPYSAPYSPGCPPCNCGSLYGGSSYSADPYSSFGYGASAYGGFSSDYSSFGSYPSQQYSPY